MLNDRLQILVTAEQRRRLRAEAKRRRTSVGGLVREAIDARYGGMRREDRIRAVAEMRRMTGGRFVPPDKLDRIVEEEREEVVRPNRPRRR